jgi:hypothetical protein
VAKEGPSSDFLPLVSLIYFAACLGELQGSPIEASNELDKRHECGMVRTILEDCNRAETIIVAAGQSFNIRNPFEILKSGKSPVERVHPTKPAAITPAAIVWVIIPL